MGKLRKYIVMYYGWINSYGGFDSDDFIVEGRNKAEAEEEARKRLKNKFVKNWGVQLLSTHKRKMKEWDEGHEERIKQMRKFI